MKEWVIAGFPKDGKAIVPRLWNLYDTEEQAQAAFTVRAADITRMFDGPADYSVMTYDEFKVAEKSLIIGNSRATEITEEEYDDALGVLPPKWIKGEEVSGFLMSEHLSGPFTNQYATFQGRYFCKLVDATDRNTWMKPDELQALQPAAPSVSM